MVEKLRQVSGTIKIGDNLYLPEGLIGDAISNVPVIPIYFGIFHATEIHHDSPAIGAYELGETTNSVHGPFFSENEAIEAIQKDSQATSHVSYECSNRIEIKLLRPEQIQNETLPQVFRYYQNCFALSSEVYSERLEYVLRPELAPTTPKVISFSQMLEKKFREYAKGKIKQTKRDLVGIVHNNRPFFCEMTLATEESPFFRYSSFSEKPTQEPFHGELSELGISPRAAQISPAREFISFTPVNFSELFLGLDSIDAIVKYHQMIH